MNTVHRFLTPNEVDSDLENALLSFSICGAFLYSHNKFVVKVRVYRTTVDRCAKSTTVLVHSSVLHWIQSAILNIFIDGRVAQPVTKARN